MIELRTRAYVAAETVRNMCSVADPTPSNAARNERLRALSEPVDPDAVDAILGNDYYTRNACDECGRHCERAVLITACHSGCFHDDEVLLCASCLREALALLEPGAEGEASDG